MFLKTTSFAAFRKAALVSATAALLLWSCSGPSGSVSASSGKGAHSAANRKPAPDFSLQDESGHEVKLSSLHGKVVLLNFWATWCGPCQLEIPWFVDFEQQLRSKGLEVVGVAMDDEGWKVVKPYLKAHNVNYRILMGNDSVTQLYGGVDSLPTTFLIDREGRIAKTHVGLAGKNEYLDEIQQLLGTGQTEYTSAGSHQPAALLSPVAAKP